MKVLASIIVVFAFLVGFSACGDEPSFLPPSGPARHADAVSGTPPGGETYVVYGDSRTNHPAHMRVVAAIGEFAPDAVFHTGDLVEDGNDSKDWESFNAITAPLRAKAEFYPALGNHEKNSPQFFDNFTLPGNERWYSVSRPGAVFVVIDSNAGLGPGSEQALWLAAELKAAAGETGNPLTVVFLHHPLFSSGPHGRDDNSYREDLIPLFERYGVDVVFSGHDHLYERSFYNGIHYVVTGGGGAPLKQKKSPNPWSEIFISKFHFCKANVVDGELVVTVYDADLNVLDIFKVENRRGTD